MSAKKARLLLGILFILFLNWTACPAPEPDPELWLQNTGAFEDKNYFNMQSEDITEGYIMDIAVKGNTVYTVVMSDDTDEDVLILFNKATGQRLDTRQIEHRNSAAICRYQDSLYIIHRSTSHFLKKYDLAGNLQNTYPVNAYPAGKLYGLAYDGEKFYFSMEVGADSVIYSYDIVSRDAVNEFSVPKKIYSLTYANGKLYAFQNCFDIYSNSWLWQIDPADWTSVKMNFFNNLIWGMDYDGSSVYAMRRSGNGQNSFAFEITGAHKITGRYTTRLVEITFPFHNGNKNSYDLDLWIPGTLDWDVQQLRNFSITPAPQLVQTDLFANQWAKLSYKGVTADIEAVLKFELAVPTVVDTLNISYVFDNTDIPQNILDIYTGATYCFDYDHAVIQDVKKQLTLQGSYLQNLLAIRNYVNDTLVVNGPSGSESRASDFLSQGVGRCYAHTLSFAAIARMYGYPTRAIAGIKATESHAEEDPQVHTWNQVYFPGNGWVDIDVLSDDDPGGSHTYYSVGYHPGTYFYTFRGNYDELDKETIFTQRGFYKLYSWSNTNSNRKAAVSSGVMRVKVEDLNL